MSWKRIVSLALSPSSRPGLLLCPQPGASMGMQGRPRGMARGEWAQGQVPHLQAGWEEKFRKPWTRGSWAESAASGLYVTASPSVSLVTARLPSFCLKLSHSRS